MRRLPVVVESQPTTGAGQTTILASDGRPTVVDNVNMAELSNATADVSNDDFRGRAGGFFGEITNTLWRVFVHWSALYTCNLLDKIKLIYQKAVRVHAEMIATKRKRMIGAINKSKH